MNEDRINHAFLTLTKLLLVMRLSSIVFAVYAMFQGALIIFGGDDRFSQLGYTFARAVPGAPPIWGVVIGAAGILGLIGVKNRMYAHSAVGMTLAGVWSMAFAVSFLLAAVKHPQANLTAIAVYGKDAVLFLLLASAQREMARQMKRESTHD